MKQCSTQQYYAVSPKKFSLKSHPSPPYPLAHCLIASLPHSKIPSSTDSIFPINKLYCCQNNPLLRKALYDPAFWLLVALNIYCIWYLHRNPGGFASVVWIYWIQSVLIGVFNFFDLLTVKHPDPDSMMVNGKPMPNNLASKGCMAFFFLFHYQFFHLVYAIFIVAGVKGKIDFRFLLISIAALLLELTIGFIRNKAVQKNYLINYGQQFIMPYVRIIPMHLMILAPAFLGLSSVHIFLILKTLADLGMYLFIQKLYSKPFVDSKI